MARERFTFFWASSSVFSQWHPAVFEVDGIEYYTAEQYMMHQKALLFGDQDIADKIMLASTPRTMKALGRLVRGYDEAVWSKERYGIVMKGNRAKFEASTKAREALLATAGTTLVEASPTDRVWGIGLRETDPRARDRSTWRGLNLLGRVLTDLREEILARD